MRPKFVHVAIAIVFFIFALLQLNDVDPLIWFLIYGAVALISFLKIYLLQVDFKPLITTIMVIFILYTLAYIPGFIDYLSKPGKSEIFGKMNVKKPWIEETREFLGLLMAIASLIYLRKSSIRLKKTNARPRK